MREIRRIYRVEKVRARAAVDEAFLLYAVMDNEIPECQDDVLLPERVGAIRPERAGDAGEHPEPHDKRPAYIRERESRLRLVERERIVPERGRGNQRPRILRGGEQPRVVCRTLEPLVGERAG